MKTMILALTLAVMASACSTKQVHVSPASDLRDGGSTIQLVINGGDVDPAVISDLTRYLKAELIIGGFDIESAGPEGIQEAEVRRGRSAPINRGRLNPVAAARGCRTWARECAHAG